MGKLIDLKRARRRGERRTGLAGQRQKSARILPFKREETEDGFILETPTMIIKIRRHFVHLPKVETDSDG